MKSKILKTISFSTLLLALIVGLSSRNQTSVFADGPIILPPGFQSEVVTDSSTLTAVSSLTVGHGGELFVADIGEAGLYGDELLLAVEWDPFVITVVKTGLPMGSPARMAVGNGHPLIGNDLVLADWNSNETAGCCNGRVFQVDPATADFTTLAIGNPAYPPPGDPFGIAIAQGGAFGDGIYVMDFEGASPYPPVLYRLNSDGSQSIVATNPSIWTLNRRPTDIAIDPGSGFGGELYVVDPISPPTVWQVNAAGDISSFLSGAPFQEPVALAFGSGGVFGTDMYIFDDATGTIFTVTPAGEISTFATGLPDNAPSSITPDMVFSPDGLSLFVGTGSSLIRISPTQLTCADLNTAIAEANIDLELVRRALQSHATAACDAYAAGDLHFAAKNICAILTILDSDKGQTHIDPASAEHMRTTAVQVAADLGIPLYCIGP